MAERLTEDQVADLAAILRADTSVDAKVQQVTHVKSSIKQHNVPDECVAPLFDALRAASGAQHAILVNAGFTALNHLLTRLSRQEPKYLVKEAPRTLPLIMDKLGDPKDKFRQLALQSLTTFYKSAPADAERFVRNTAMVGKNPRAKEASLQWILQMHQENGLQFRSYVPTLMELLEDADGMVRDAAKATVIELFRNAPGTAKSDLKRQLKNFKVRPAIEGAIVKALAPSSTSASQNNIPDEAPPVPVARPNFAASVSSMASERPITPMPETKAEQVEPLYVNTQRELDDIFREMHQYFDGKETEQNWLKREESCIKLRRLMVGNAATDYAESFLGSLRTLLDGIIKAIISLRTSLSKEGCSLVQEIARVFGPGMDPMVELLMQTFIKLAAATKKISSQQANVCVDTIIGRATYTGRFMQHIWGACQDKNVQPRLYASGWLRTILNKEAHHKSHIEHGGGLELVEKCIKKGLGDANPNVREQMRSTYWTFAGIWPTRAEVIMENLDATAQKLLRNDSHNPNAATKRADAPVVRPGMGFSKSTMVAGTKSSVREAMLAQKKAMASKNLPPRPGSAMAHISPGRTASNLSTTSAISTASTASNSTVRARPDAGMMRGISGAPVRPVRRRPERPELAPRPATAGPYSARNQEQSSPPEPMRTKAATPKSMIGGASPKRTVTKPKLGHASTASEGHITTPTRPATLKTATTASPHSSPRVSPAKLKLAPSALASSSPSRAHEDFTLVVPQAAALNRALTEPSRHMSPAEERFQKLEPAPIIVPDELLRSSPPPVKVYEDPFTGDQTTPKPTYTAPVLEDKAVNEDAATLVRSDEDGMPESLVSPEKSKQNSRLLDSGIAKVKAQSLDVHGFRKLQGIIRDHKAIFTDEKFDSLLGGLYEFLESPLAQVAPEKVPDVKAQVLATIKLLLKKMRDNFQPHISRGLESLLRTRACYDGRSHIVSGLELLATELATLGDASELILVLSRMLESAKPDTAGSRTLSMGLHVLTTLIDTRPTFVLSDAELATLTGLATKCLHSQESGVRMDAVQLCVAVHARVGDARFWESLKGVKDDPKSLITYYIVKRQREAAAV